MPVSPFAETSCNPSVPSETLYDTKGIIFPQVFFYIDPEFETDPKMDGVNNLILSYTFFKVNES